MLVFSKPLPFVHFSCLRDTFGDGYDFLELREYQYNQDARFIAPLASLKYGRPMVKTYSTQAFSYVHICLFVSKSLLLGKPRKLEFISRICEILLQSAAFYQLKALVHILDSKAIRTLDNALDISRFLDECKNVTLAQRETFIKLPFSYGLHFLLTQRHKKGLMVLLGDFFELDFSLNPQVLHSSFKHSLLLYGLCVRDKSEIDPKPGFCVQDVESNQVYASMISYKLYEQRLRAYNVKLQSYFANLGAHFSLLSTQDELPQALQRIF